jgi:hypothetical protein
MNPSQIYANNNALAQYGQTQAQNYQGQANQNLADYSTAQQNLSNYRANMQDPSQMYQGNLQQAENQFGFNPNELKNAQQALAATQTTMANLPSAVQQSANGRGLTGAQMANRLTQQAGTLNGVLAGQGNAVNALQSLYQNAQGQAAQQTQFGVQGEQMNLATLQNLVQNVQAQEDKALQQVDYFNGLRAQGYALNVQEQQAQAAAAAAAAQAEMAKAQLEQAATSRMMAQAELSAGGNTQAAAQKNPAQFNAIQNYQSPGTGFMQDLINFLQNQGFMKQQFGEPYNQTPGFGSLLSAITSFAGQHGIKL